MLHLLKEPKWIRATLGILICIAAVAIAGYATLAPKFPLNAWSFVWRMLVLFALLGIVLGAVVMLDARSSHAVGDYPIIRVVLCAFAAGAMVAVMPFLGADSYDPRWGLLAVPAGAILGWYAWRWAQYVDF